jgi:hypothetical protein
MSINLAPDMGPGSIQKETSMSDYQKLNPMTKKMDIGKRQLEEIEIFPLTIGEQLQVGNFISELASEVSVAIEMSKQKDMDINAAIISAVMESLKKNLAGIIASACDIDQDKANEIMGKITNVQLVTFLTYVWETSFEEALKNGVSLFEKMKNGFLSKRSLPQSCNGSLNTDSMISSENHIEMEESHTGS